MFQGYSGSTGGRVQAHETQHVDQRLQAARAIGLDVERAVVEEALAGLEADAALGMLAVGDFGRTPATCTAQRLHQ